MSVYKDSMHIVLTWEADNWGGVDYLVNALIKEWPDNSVHFTLITNKGNLGLERIKNSFNGGNRVDVIFCRPFDLFKLRFSKCLRFILLPFFFGISIFKYFLILRRLKADVIIAVNGGYPASYGVISSTIAAYFLKLPVRTLVICHAAIKSQIFLFNFSKLLDLFLSKILSSVIFISNATKRSVAINTSLLDSEILNSTVIHMGVADVLSHSPELRKFVADKFNLYRDDDSAKILGIVGRIQPYKGHEDIIFGLSRLPQDVRNKLKLLIIGTGNFAYVEKLKKMIDSLALNKSVHFLGYVDGPSELIIEQLDLLIMGTRTFEGFGLTIPEAMIVGTPVMATSVGAVPEFVSQEYISLIEPGRTDQIAFQLLDFYENTLLWDMRSKKGIQYIADNFSVSIMIDRYYNHIRQLHILNKR